MHSSHQLPHLGQLTPYHGSDPSGQKSIAAMRFHGSQRLNLMRPTRLPANSRRYSRGDPVNLIDWRAYARNEQLIIREHLDEASCRVQIIVDEGPAATWPDAELAQKLGRHHCSKRELNWRLALHLAYQYLKLGDSVYLDQRQDLEFKYLPLRSSTEVAIYFEQLLHNGFQSTASLAFQSKQDLLVQKQRCDILIWISDGLEGIPSWLLEKKGAMTSWIHALASLEVNVSWLQAEDCYFELVPQPREFLGKALLDHDHLQNGIKTWREVLERQWLRAHRHYLMVHDASPIEMYLRQLERAWQGPGQPAIERKS